MHNQFARTEILVGSAGMERLKRARVAVFGIGGVGGYVVEALARSGIGTLDLVDADKICLTNLNRQIIAVRSTLGQYKVDAAKERILDINPDAAVHAYRTFYMPDTAGQFDFTAFDYVVDAIDTVTGKLTLVEQAKAAGTPIISAMGAGNKMDPAAFMAADIYETSVCPLARVMRRELKKRGITHLKVVYSKETPIKPVIKPVIEPEDSMEAGAGTDAQDGGTISRGEVPGSNAFVPAAAGLVIAGEVIRDLLGTCYTAGRKNLQ